jgi:aryl-alcohol dehydrogenase-like predicted oxidoreductase
MRTWRISAALPPVPVIALGIDAFGSGVTDDAAFALLDSFAAAGGTLIDTAHVYGGGASERCLGRWLRLRGNRERMLVATKGAHPSADKPHRLSAADIASDVTESLDRLGTDHIDLYWLHRDEPDRDVGDILSTLEAHRTAGRIRAYGTSNWTTARMDAAADYAKRHGIPGFCAAQQGWSLAERSPDHPGWPGCRYIGDEDRTWHVRSGLALCAFTPQARGFFAKDVPDYDTPVGRQRRERARHLAAELGVTANQVALAWLTNQSFPGIAVVGAHRPQQLADSLAAGALALSAAQVAWLADG